MNRVKIAVALTIAVAAAGLTFAKGREAEVRVVHASPDAPAVDVKVNGAVAVPNLAFGSISGYASLPAGQYDVQVVPAGLNSPVVIDLTGDNAVNLFYNRDYTVVALNILSKIEPLLLVDNNNPAPRPFARVRFVHASPDAPAVDIAVAGGPVLFGNIPFKGVGDYVEVPKGFYDLEVRLAGTKTVVLPLPAVKLEGGTTYTVFAMGFAAGNPSLHAVIAVDAENPGKDNGKAKGLSK